MFCNIKIQLLIIVVSLVSQSSQSGCKKVTLLRSAQPQTKIPNLETGHLEVFADAQKGRYNWFTYTYKLRHNPMKVSVSLNIVFMRNYQNKNLVDFSLRPIKRDASFLGLFTISTDTKWTVVHIHYVVTSRVDILCGYFVPSQNYLLVPTQAGKMRQSILYHQFQRSSLPPKGGAKTVAFIAGLKCDQSTFNFTIVQQSFILTEARMEVLVRVTNTTKPIQYFAVSYFAVSSISQQIKPTDFKIDYFQNIVNDRKTDQSGVAGIAAFDGMTLGLLSKNKKPPKKRLLAGSFTNPRANNASPFSFYDLTYSPLKNAGQDRDEYTDYVKQSLLNETERKASVLDELSDDQLYYFRKAFQVLDIDLVTTVYLQPIYRLDTRSIPMQGECKSFQSCAQSRGIVVGQKCIICPPNKVYNFDTQQCECNEGYIKFDNDCTKIEQMCAPDQVYINGSCYEQTKTKKQCDTYQLKVYNSETKQCKCIQGYKQVLVGNVKVCILQCPPLTRYSIETQECICKQGYKKIKGKCMMKQCKQLQIWDQKIEECVCEGNSYRAASGCMACPQFSKLNAKLNKCECQTGYEENGSRCEPAVVKNIAVAAVQNPGVRSRSRFNKKSN